MISQTAPAGRSRCAPRCGAVGPATHRSPRGSRRCSRFLLTARITGLPVLRTRPVVERGDALGAVHEHDKHIGPARAAVACSVTCRISSSLSAPTRPPVHEDTMAVRRWRPRRRGGRGDAGEVIHYGELVAHDPVKERGLPTLVRPTSRRWAGHRATPACSSTLGRGDLLQGHRGLSGSRPHTGEQIDEAIASTVSGAPAVWLL